MLSKGFMARGLALLVCGMPLLIATAEQEYYTWVDENGVTNYAQKKPTNREARFITSSYRFGFNRDAADETSKDTSESSTSSSTSSSSTSSEGVDPDALIAGQKAIIQAQLAEEKKFNCDVGKTNLSRLESYRRMRIKDSDGTERAMTSDEMDAKKTESRALIRENCTS